MLREVQYTCLLTQSRTNTPGELREGVSGIEKLVGKFPVAFIQGVVPFRRFVSERARPVAERYTAIHAA